MNIIRDYGQPCVMIMVVVAVTRLLLAEQQILSYTQSLSLVLLSIPLLNEKPSLTHCIAVLIGFCGVLLVALGRNVELVAPGVIIPHWVYLLAVAQGVVDALTVMQIRQLSATESSTTIAIWQAILMTVATLVALPFIWVSPGIADLLCLIAVEAFAGIAQILQTEAFASAQVSAVGPFSYTGLLWAALIGWLGFGELPSVTLLLGARRKAIARCNAVVAMSVIIRAPRLQPMTLRETGSRITPR